MHPQDEFISKLSESIRQKKSLIKWHIEKGNHSICRDMAGKIVAQREILHIIGGSTAGEGGEDA